MLKPTPQFEKSSSVKGTITLKDNDDTSENQTTVTAKLSADERSVIAELSVGEKQLGEVFIELWDGELRVYLSDRKNLEHGGQMFVLDVLEDHVTAALARQ